MSKFRPLEQLREVYDAGQRVFAESRPLELEAKVGAMPSDVQWHFIGHLQTNKLRNVLPYVHLIHSVDSVHLLDAIQNWCACRGMKVGVLLEVHIGAEQTKQGFTPEEVETLSDGGFSQWPCVSVRGLMGMASHTEDSARIDADFQRIEELFNRIRSKHPELSGFTELSIGMSADWQIAVRHGATMVRIGSAIFD